MIIKHKGTQKKLNKKIYFTRILKKLFVPLLLKTFFCYLE